MTRSTMAAALASLAVMLGPWPAGAQAPEGDPPAAAAPAPNKPASAKPVTKKPAPEKPMPRKPPAKAAGPATPMAATPVLLPPNLTVLCEGQPARYAAETGVPIWVLRSGLAAVENPLRPLTPETTRVLQVVVGDRGATAYGPDLAGLRRGGTPAALQASLGAAIRWDDALTLLPDTLVIVSEANETLARLPFRECSAAPAVKAEPAKPKPQAKPRRPTPAEGETAERKARPDKTLPGNTLPSNALPKGLVLPQGAIPANP